MIQVWGRTNSSNVMKVLWLLDELGLAHERIDAGLAFGRNDTPEYRKMNPFGLVPVIQDDDITLFESNSILRYLCNAHAPDTPLYPKLPAARGRVEMWMDAQLATMTPVGIVFQQLVRLPPERRDEPVLADALSRSGTLFGLLNDRLAHQPWLAGQAMTLADIAYGPAVHRWFGLRIARPDLRNLRAYYERLRSRPAYVARCAGPLT
jgi:glutathione S-transferase